MIRVEKLTKMYGDYAAVRDVTFEVARGQIVGFLGPNGAGKSTTMRILAGYLTATSGKAFIDGVDVFWQPVESRRKIGYMPESCPLYLDMRVEEYLHYRAGIKGLHGRLRRQRLDFVLQRCWVADVRRQLIGTLSKGYRQRVGLADSLLADPPVLILDEPTAGLDPTQIRETRQLIRELGKHHTILLSTHILSEVEAACDQVIIIHQGQVAAAGPLDKIASPGQGQSVIELVADGDVDPDLLEGLPHVIGYEGERIGDAIKLRVFTKADPDFVTPHVCQLAVERNWGIREVRPRRQTLEEVFVRITGGT